MSRLHLSHARMSGSPRFDASKPLLDHQRCITYPALSADVSAVHSTPLHSCDRTAASSITSLAGYVPRRSSECAMAPGLLGDTPIVVVDVESLEGGPEDMLLCCCFCAGVTTCRDACARLQLRISVDRCCECANTTATQTLSPLRACVRGYALGCASPQHAHSHHCTLQLLSVRVLLCTTGHLSITPGIRTPGRLSIKPSTGTPGCPSITPGIGTRGARLSRPTFARRRVCPPSPAVASQGLAALLGRCLGSSVLSRSPMPAAQNSV